MLFVLTVASRKGGAGKTTITSHLAVEAVRCGHGPVAMIDTDDMEGLTKWWKARSAETPVLVDLVDDVSTTLKALKKQGFKVVFIDTPPAITQSSTDAIRHADLVLVPVQPTPDDLRAVGGTVSLTTVAKRQFVFVMSRVKKRVRLTAEAAVTLSQYGPIAPTMIGDRTDYAGAKTGGLTAPELDPMSPAAGEVAALWTYIENKLGITREVVAA